MSPPVASPTPSEAVSPRSLALARSARVAVIGAGISGLACASHLVSSGFRVQVFDKGRGSGGRSATRRQDFPSQGSVPKPRHFDHGAQYFTVRAPAFAERVGTWLAGGAVAPWQGRVRVVERGEVRETVSPEQSTVRYVGVPGMSALTRRLARESRLRTGVYVASLERKGRRWLVQDDDGHGIGRFDLVAAAVPAPQAASLLEGSTLIAAQARAVHMLPTWAVLAAYAAPLDLPFDGAFVHDSPLSWVARNNSKPGRPPAECWVLHGSHPWSAEHVESEPRQIVNRLIGALAEAAGADLPAPEHTTAHLWRYAAPETALALRYLFDAEAGLGACGDWCGGPRVEGAYLSGLALAEAIAASWGDLAGAG